MSTKRSKSVTVKFTSEEWERVEAAAGLIWDERTRALLKPGVVVRDLCLRCADIICNDPALRWKQRHHST